MPQRIVIDTHVYVSRAFRSSSVPGLAVAKAWTTGIPLISEPTWDELRAVFVRKKFSPYISTDSVQVFLDLIREISELIEIPAPIRACRDPHDDKFVELAVYGRADILISGDDDLLRLHPIRGIAILTPADFLNRP